MNDGIKQQQIVLKNLLVTYYTTSTKSDKTLLFLHGWRSNSTLWFKLFPELTQLGYQLYAMDFPGFGKSETQKEAYTLQDYVDIVTEFIKKLDLHKPVLIGHSHGGRVAIKLASENSDLLDCLVLVDSAGICPKNTSLTIKKTLATMVQPLFKPHFMQPLKTKLYKAMGAEDYVATPQLKQTFINIINEDLTNKLSLIQNKTLILWGDKDLDTPISDADLMKEKIQHSELHIIKEAGHYSFLDKPEEFNKKLMHFLKEN